MRSRGNRPGGLELTLSGAEGVRELRQLLAYAPQEAVLVEASLRHNLLLVRLEASDRALAERQHQG